jgi:hypothetical protein
LLIAKYGTTKWSLIAAKIPSKTNKHCRRRWQACVNANGNKGAWAAEEDAKLIEGHLKYGNRWTEIARLVPGRTDNAAKNRFVALTKNANLHDGKKVSATVVPSGSCVTGDSGRKSSPSLGGECDTHDSKAQQVDLNSDCSESGDCNSDSSSLFQEWSYSGCGKNSSATGSPREWLDLNRPLFFADGESAQVRNAESV